MVPQSLCGFYLVETGINAIVDLVFFFIHSFAMALKYFCWNKDRSARAFDPLFTFRIFVSSLVFCVVLRYIGTVMSRKCRDMLLMLVMFLFVCCYYLWIRGTLNGIPTDAEVAIIKMKYTILCFITNQR